MAATQSLRHRPRPQQTNDFNMGAETETPESSQGGESRSPTTKAMAGWCLPHVGRRLQWPQRLQFLRGYLAVGGAILVHLTLGSIYTFGNLMPYVTSYIRHRSNPQGLTAPTSVWLYALAMVGHGSSMFLGGWLERKIGPRLTTMFGASLMTLGVLLSYPAIKLSFWLLLLTYGLLFGLGLGIAYVSSLVCAMRWMPRWKGVAAGFVLAGLGLGALIFDPIQTAFINPDNLPGDENGYFNDDDLLDRVPLIFPILGVIYAVMQLIGSLLIVNPPEKEEEVLAESNDKNQDEKHRMKRAEKFFKSARDSDFYSSYSRNSTPPLKKHGKESPGAELPPQSLSESNGVTNNNGTINSIKEAEDSFSSQDEGSHLLNQKLNAPQYSNRQSSDATTKKLSTTRMKSLNRSADLEGSISSVMSTSSRNVVVSLRPGQMLKKFNFYLLWAMMFLSGFATIFTASLYKVFGFSFTSDDHFLAIVGATASICNCAGRIVWGLVADVVSYKFALVLQSGIMTSFLLTFYSTSVAGKPMFLIWVCIIFFCLGGIFSLYPTAVSRSFGPEYMGMNYGLLFTSQIGSAIFSVLILSTLQNVLSWYEVVFLMSGFSFFSFLLILIFRQKRYVMLVLGR